MVDLHMFLEESTPAIIIGLSNNHIANFPDAGALAVINKVH
jgi:hypothetical protein